MDQQNSQNQQGANQPAGAQPVNSQSQPGASSQPVQPGMSSSKPAGAMNQEDKTPANFQLGALFKDGIKIKLAPHPNTQFDDDKFLMLLASSISLSKTEKKKILDAVPKLKQWQIDELINIFEEEQEQAKKAEEEQKKAEEIRKSLGL